MTLLRSILLTAGSAACVSLAIFVGHALSTHHMEPVYLGLGIFVAGAGLLFVYNRMGGRSGEPAAPGR